MSKIIDDNFQGLQPEFVSVDKEILIAAYDSARMAIEYVKLAQIELVRSQEPETLKYKTWEHQMKVDLEVLKNRLKLLEPYR